MSHLQSWASQVALVAKNSPLKAGDKRHSLISGLGRSPGGGYATCSSIHAWRIPWTEEYGRLWPLGSQRVGHRLEQFSTHAPPHWVLPAWVPSFSLLPAQTLWPDWPPCLPLCNQALTLFPLLAPSHRSHLQCKFNLFNKTFLTMLG